MPRWKRSHGGWLPLLLLQGTPSPSGLSLSLERQRGTMDRESSAEVGHGNFIRHSSLFASEHWPNLGAPVTGLDLCSHFQQLVLLRNRQLRPSVERLVKQRLQLGKARLHRLRGVGAVTPFREGFRMTSDLSTGISAGRVSVCGTSWAIHTHWGEVATCQVSQDVCPGGQRGVTGPQINRLRGEQQEEVEGSGDEGQGQTDCPGAAAKAPYHPAERVDERESKRLEKCKNLINLMLNNLLGKFDTLRECSIGINDSCVLYQRSKGICACWIKTLRHPSLKARREYLPTG